LKKIAITLLLVFLAALTVSCAKSSTSNNPGWAEFKNEDFRFEYPSEWKAATDGGELDQFKGKGIIAVNSFNKKDFWVKPIVRSELLHAAGGLMVNRLPENGVYMFVMESGLAGDKSTTTSELNASTEPFGTPVKFKEFANGVMNSLDKFPEDKRENIKRKWTIKNEDWLHYRIEFKNHGKQYDAHIYLLGDSVEKDAKNVEKIIKSFKLVDPAPKSK